MSGALSHPNRTFPLKKLDNLLDRSNLPDDIDLLKDLLISTTRLFLEEIEGFKTRIEALSETIDCLNGQLSVLRRFQYGQRSERLKKKLLK